MMMGTCMVFNALGMLTPFIAAGAIIYLIVAKRKNPDLQEAH